MLAMPFLPGLAVVFVGIVGGDHHHRVEQQVQLMLQELDVKATPINSAAVRSLARHDRSSAEIVRRLHVDGAVGGELVTQHGHTMLRLVVYSADGAMKSLAETSLVGLALPRDAIAALTSNLGDEVAALDEARRVRDKKSASVAAQGTTRRSKN
jgi:predicted HD phosphohydrolase